MNMSECYDLRDYSKYNEFEYIKVRTALGEIKYFCISNCLNNFTISKFYKKDIVNLWGDDEEEAKEEILSNRYFADEDKIFLLEILDGKQEYCWEINYSSNGLHPHCAYAETCYVAREEIQCQEQLDKWIVEILDWVWSDCQFWTFTKADEDCEE